MKQLNQLCILLGIAALGELLSALVGKRIPASIVGMGLLFALLFFGLLKKSSIEDCCNFFLQNMAFFFIAPTLGILDNYVYIQADLFAIVFICAITTYLTALSVGLTVGVVNRVQHKKGADV